MNGGANLMSDTKSLYDAVFSAWSFGRLNDAVKIGRLLLTHNISLNELEKYVKDSQGQKTAPESKPKTIHFERFCPSCGSPLSIHTIKTPQGKANVYGYRSRWACFACGWEEYSTLQVPEEVLKYPPNG